jgi:hypothetical protein
MSLCRPIAENKHSSLDFSKKSTADPLAGWTPTPALTAAVAALALAIARREGETAPPAAETGVAS